MKATIRYKAISDVGCKRANNEDMAWVAGKLLRDGSLAGEIPSDASAAAFAVADGMGGYEGGEIASEIACRAFTSYMNTWQEGATDATLRSIKDWARSANGLVIKTASIRSELSDMGTTFVGLIFCGEKGWLVNIGDSRCYRLRSGVLKQLTSDHSEQWLKQNPDIPSNIIFNFMGASPDDFFSDVSNLTPLPGDIYLLCSDGLSDLVDADTIESNAEDPDRLIELAKEAGGRDNITIIQIEYDSQPRPSTP